MRPPRAEQQRRHPTGTDLVAVSPTLAALADRQDGVVTRDQLLTHGMTIGQIRAAVSARRWRALGRRVVVLHSGALSPGQRLWAATLFPVKPTALAGLSGAGAAGLRGFDSDTVHIVVPHDTRTNLPPWITIHESRRFSCVDIEPASPPRTSVARSLVDAAAWSRSPRRACAILCAGVQQRLTTARRLSAELEVAGAVRHCAILRPILGDIGGGGHTLAEIELGPLAARAGLPPPRRQALRREPNGKVRYLDAEFDLPDGTTLAVEIDGAIHLLTEKAWDDSDRSNEVVIGGSPMLRFPSIRIRLEPERVVDQLRRMRDAHG